MEKINIAELLKDCPKGMELDCVMYENVTLDKVSDINFLDFPIQIRIRDGNITTLTKYGEFTNSNASKCVIFPKGKTTWEGFVPPCKFKDGDIVYVKTDPDNHIIIYKKLDNYYLHRYINLSNEENFYCSQYGIVCTKGEIREIRLATEEEKEKLFQAIKDNGYRWNAEKKELEKLIEPKFKVGDRIKHKESCISGVVTEIYDEHYRIKYNSGAVSFPNIKFQDEYELVPNKFDITTLKPFQEVLVRCNSLENWHIQFFEKYNTKSSEKYPFICLCNSKYCQCIPYNDETKHLLGTTNDCDNFYKTWE